MEHYPMERYSDWSHGPAENTQPWTIVEGRSKPALEPRAPLLGLKELPRTTAEARPHPFATAGTNKEKVKLFIGFDYECPRGHRFMVQEPGKPLRHRRALGALTTTAAPLLKSDLPLWMPCTCKREPLVSAQLMRIHVVTPKAPVSVAISPRVQADPNDSGVFHMGQDVSIELTWAKYYVIRLPYVYVGPYGPTHPPNGPQVAGRFHKDFMSVAHTPLT